MKGIIPVLFFLGVSMLRAQDRSVGKAFVTRSEVMGCKGMAATSHPLASQVAIDILQQGGHAVDAAIAANAMLGLVEPMSCGIGGDLFALVWDAQSEKLYGLNASGRSAAGLSLADLKAKGLEEVPVRGPLPVTVPGCVDGWYELHQRFGQLPMAKILAPTITYAREGFPVTEIIAHAWQRSASYLDQYVNFRRTYLPGGKAPVRGEIFRNPDLGATLAQIAEAGRQAFYEGQIAIKISTYLKEKGGYLTRQDLRKHQSTWVEPLSTNYRGYDIWELPPNGQGIAVLQILNILEQYDIAAMGFGSADYLHHLIEAKKIVYEDRACFYADPAFNQLPVTTLISKDYARQRSQLLDPRKAADSYPAGRLKAGDTVYLTVADKQGNMVSLIQSIYWGFGSGLVPDGLGFALQNRGALFSLDPEHYNCYAPGKRPFHTIIPAFITKAGRPYISFGVMGGAMQPQGQVQVVINLIDFGMGLQETGDAPRIRHSGSSQPNGGVMGDGGTVYIESGFPAETLRELAQKGHQLVYEIGIFGGYQAIRYDHERRVYHGASECRKDGMAVGY